MLADRYRLRELTETLEGARRRAVSERSKFYCAEMRDPPDDAISVDRDAGTYTRRDRVFKPPRSMAATLERDDQGNYVKVVEIPLGVHGRAFLAVCPDCGSVSCGACTDDCLECGGAA